MAVLVTVVSNSIQFLHYRVFQQQNAHERPKLILSKTNYDNGNGNGNNNININNHKLANYLKLVLTILINY
jgi:hypothetical protein